MEGILVIDKPVGPTSHDVVDRVRKAGGLRRVGHSGTLDPLASGVLVLGIGRATRLIEYIVGQPKTYAAVVRFGHATNTYDAEGELSTGRPVPLLSQGDLDGVLNRFRGEIDQVPPLFSAIKKDGQPLYKLARRGEKVDIPPRKVTIYRLEITRWESPDLHLEIDCSTGTYIRSLAHDIGQALGCGGYLAALRRTALGRFSLAQAAPLDGVRADNFEDLLLPLETAVAHLPHLSLTPLEEEALINGRWIEQREGDPAGELAAVYERDGRFLGLVRRHEEVWKPSKIFPAAADPS